MLGKHSLPNTTLGFPPPPPDPLSLQNELSFSLSTEVQMKKSLLSLAILAAVCPAAAFAADSAEQIHTIVWEALQKYPEQSFVQ